MKKYTNPTLPGTPVDPWALLTPAERGTGPTKPSRNVHAAMEMIVLDPDGYVRGVRCGKNHSGNSRLAGPTNGHYECAGCGEMVPASDVLACQLGPIGGQKGQGGIYRVR